MTGASTVKRRLQAVVALRFTKFVRRDMEIESLVQALGKASSGHGQVVAAVGEAGVGKFRLVYEFIHSYRIQAWRVLESASVEVSRTPADAGSCLTRTLHGHRAPLSCPDGAPGIDRQERWREDVSS